MEDSSMLDRFFVAIRRDPCISTAHISIYMALVFYARNQPIQAPIHVFSQQIIDICKISSRSTYYRCIRDLADFGYVDYTPVFSKHRPSVVRLILM